MNNWEKQKYNFGTYTPKTSDNFENQGNVWDTYSGMNAPQTTNGFGNQNNVWDTYSGMNAPQTTNGFGNQNNVWNTYSGMNTPQTTNNFGNQGNVCTPNDVYENMNMPHETAQKQENTPDSDLYQRAWKNILKHEDIKYHPYLDTKGKITVGVGTNIDNCDDFVKVNFTQKKNSVSDAQKNYVCNQLRQASQRLSGRWNIDAEEYKKATDLRIDDEEAQRLAQQHLTNDVAHLRSEFSDFDNFPMPLKEVLVDLQYNTGNLTEKKWPKLYEAIRNRDVEGIAKNVHRKDVGKERNDWAENLVRSIRF